MPKKRSLVDAKTVWIGWTDIVPNTLWIAVSVSPVGAQGANDHRVRIGANWGKALCH
ncbi:MAG: hypothetical protein ACO3JV_10230 [Pseudomonadales bacterium]